MSLHDLIILNEKCEEYEAEIGKLQEQNKLLRECLARFVPEPEILQWERREIEARELLKQLEQE